jgi:hypothetical protein
LVAEWVEWDRRRELRETSHAISAMRVPWVHDTYAEIQRRRPQLGRLGEEWRQRHGGEYRGGPVTW